MERLTKPNGNGEYYFPACWRKCKGNPQDCDNCPEDDKICQKLGEYEDAEESGLMVRLPCKVGDTVYLTENVYNMFHHIPQKAKVIAFYWHNERNEIWFNCKFGKSQAVSGFASKSIGKTVFLTREEAEQTMKERDAK